MNSDSSAANRDRAYAAGQTAYPGIELSPDVFASAWDRLAALRHARIGAEGSIAGGPLSGGDLFLATACDAGVSAAWETLAHGYVPRLRGLLRKHGATDAEASELLADLPGLLCEPPPKAPARTRIGTYDGSGLLISWLSIYVLRTVNARRRRRAEVVGLPQDPLPQVATLREAAPQRALSAEALARFEAAIGEAWAALTARERLAFLLKHRDRLSGREIARVLGVGEPRVSRILGAGLEKIRACVSRGMPGTPPGSRTPDRAVWMALTDALERHLATIGRQPHDPGDAPHA